MSANPYPAGAASSRRPAGNPPASSRALEWLWQHFAEVPRLQILDCGCVRQATLDVLLRRGSKLYLTDLVTPLLRSDPAWWDRSGKQPVFLPDKFIEQLPKIPPESLSAIFCWHLLDLVPRDALPGLVARFTPLLAPGGVVYGFLREPYLSHGAETAWWLVSLTELGSTGEGREPFPYPVLTNREMERLFPSWSVKTFLTRSGRREVLVVK